MQAKEIVIQEAKNVEKDWLNRQITLEEVEESNMVKNKRLGTEPIPFGFQNEMWRALRDQMIEGDELWEFSSSLKSWQSLAGCGGIALVRNDEIIAAIVTMIS